MLGSPNIRAGWAHLTAGASSSNNGQSFEVHSEGASGMEEAASSAVSQIYQALQMGVRVVLEG